MGSCVGDASISGTSSRNGSISISMRCRLAVSLRNLALPTSAHVRSTPSRTRKPLRLLKKLSRAGGGGDRRQGYSSIRGRDLVPGSDAGRAEERLGLSVGPKGDASAPAQGSALRQRLFIRRDL